MKRSEKPDSSGKMGLLVYDQRPMTHMKANTPVLK